jgi:hypothetical protein
MAFQGSLVELHLPDIIQLVSVSGKTGVFHLTEGSHKGRIWLLDGRIVHSELGDLEGEEAVYALAIWRKGEFRFEAGLPAPRQTIQKTNTNLLMEAARRLDEWRVLSKKIPSVDLVPEFVVPANREGQINLNTMEWLLLSKIDGKRTLRQVAAATQMGVFDAAKLLYGLVATELIRLKDAGASPLARPASPASPGGASRAAPSVAATPSAPVAAPAAPAAPSVRSTSPSAPRAVATPPPPSAPEASAAPAPSPSPAASPTPAGAAALLTRLAHLRDECVALLGPVGESVVQKHYQRARMEIERGVGPEAIEEAARQISRAAGILKGSAVGEAVLRLLRSQP